jgi:hypothetical protein
MRAIKLEILIATIERVDFCPAGRGRSLCPSTTTARQDAPHESFTDCFAAARCLRTRRLRQPCFPEQRPYTAEETRELAMEALNRSGLSFDEYHAKKAALLGESLSTRKVR